MPIGLRPTGSAALREETLWPTGSEVHETRLGGKEAILVARHAQVESGVRVARVIEAGLAIAAALVIAAALAIAAALVIAAVLAIAAALGAVIG